MVFRRSHIISKFIFLNFSKYVCVSIKPFNAGYEEICIWQFMGTVLRLFQIEIYKLFDGNMVDCSKPSSDFLTTFQATERHQFSREGGRKRHSKYAISLRAVRFFSSLKNKFECGTFNFIHTVYNTVQPYLTASPKFGTQPQ